MPRRASRRVKDCQREEDISGGPEEELGRSLGEIAKNSTRMGENANDPKQRRSSRGRKGGLGPKVRRKRGGDFPRGRRPEAVRLRPDVAAEEVTDAACSRRRPGKDRLP